MPPIKVDKNFNFEKQGKKIQTKFAKETPDILKDLILKSMGKGESPVDKGRWDTPYSKSYRDAIRDGTNTILEKYNKKATPVNLKLSGQLHKSLDVKRIKNYTQVSFKSTGRYKLGKEKKTIKNSKLADIHNRQGAGKAKAIRRVLPTEKGEIFNKTIQTRLTLLLRKIVQRAIK
jgi:hypothetical protein